MKPSAVITSLTGLLPIRRPTMIWGPPGAGKSDVVRSVARQLDLPLIDLRLSLYDPTVLQGFPVLQDGVMRFAPPALLPRDGEGILFLDELTNAPPSVQAVAYQLVLDRRIGEYELPDGWVVVAAGNRAADKGLHYNMLAPLANRFTHIDFEVCAKEWDEWAKHNGISFEMRAFLRFKEALLTQAPTGNSPAFASPRTWEASDRIWQSKVQQGVKLDLIKGTVGDGPAIEFTAFANVASQLPTLSSILKDPTGTQVPSRPDAQHAVVTLLESSATQENMDTISKYIQRLPENFQALFMVTGIQRDGALAETASAIEWIDNNQEVLL